MSETTKTPRVTTTADYLDAFVRGVDLGSEGQAALRDEFGLMIDTLSMLRESLAQLSRSADERSRRDGEVASVSDAWALGYAAGKAREAQNMAANVGALQNSLDVWATQEIPRTAIHPGGENPTDPSDDERAGDSDDLSSVLGDVNAPERREGAA